MNHISITNSKNNVGAYINDIDLKNLDQSKAEEIKKALNQFGVIFIKEQNLNPESYQNFAKSIGQPVVYPRLKGLDEKFPFINVIERKPDDKNLSFGSSWLHQDTSYLADDRPRYTMLMGIEIPNGQGNTIFSSGFNAYEKLPTEIKDKIKDATGIFSSAGPISVTRLEREKEMGIKLLADLKETDEYDGIILAVAHKEFKFYKLKSSPNQVIYDIKGLYQKENVDKRL